MHRKTGKHRTLSYRERPRVVRQLHSAYWGLVSETGRTLELWKRLVRA